MFSSSRYKSKRKAAGDRSRRFYVRIFYTTNLYLPTGALDSRATDELLRMFRAINAGGQTILMVTHSVKAASHANRVMFIRDGEVFHQIYRGDCTEEMLYTKISETLTILATGEGRIGGDRG